LGHKLDRLKMKKRITYRKIKDEKVAGRSTRGKGSTPRENITEKKDQEDRNKAKKGQTRGSRGGAERKVTDMGTRRNNSQSAEWGKYANKRAVTYGDKKKGNI